MGEPTGTPYESTKATGLLVIALDRAEPKLNSQTDDRGDMPTLERLVTTGSG